MVECQLHGDRRAAGVAGDVGAPHAEMVEQRRGVGGVVGDAHRRRGVRASDPTALVIPDELVAVGERRFREQRQEAVRDDRADEQHRLARSGHLVLQFHVVDLYALHGSSSFGAGGLWSATHMREQDRYGGNSHGYGRAVALRSMALDRRRAMTDAVGETVVQRARDAASRGDWEAAFELFMRADADGLAGPGDLPVLGEVAYAAGHLDVTIEAWERAYALCVEAGDKDAAAGAAVRVAMHLLFDTALMAPVRGWLARAERLLEGRGETPAGAWLAVVRAYERMLTGDLPGARPWARRAIELGSRLDPAACALGRVAEARLLILDGDVEQGLALLDEVGVATVSGDLDPLSTGVVYCELVCALQGLAQYDVAEEWTEAMERWCKTNAIGSLHGRCRVHRAEILRLRGSCGEAETEALGACEELRPYLRREMGWPLSELGRIRLRRGDIEGAEEALLAAHRAGWDPQPGLALVRLAQGDAATAAASIRDALEHPMRVPFKERPPDSELQRAPLLEAQVEIEIAAGDIARARSAADELTRVAARFESKALVAGATLAHGRVRLAEGDPADAERFCAEAARLWSEVGAPYEAALARAGLADALRASGSEHRAALELEAARTVLDRIEAERTADDAVSVERDGGAEEPPSPTSTCFAGRATTGRWSSRGARCECETSRASGTSRGCSPTPAVSSTCSTSSPPRAARSARPSAAVRPACRTQVPAMPARCSTREPRTPTAGASPRSRTTSSRRAPSTTPSERRRQTQNATSSSGSSRARSASVAATDAPRQPPSGLESA